MTTLFLSRDDVKRLLDMSAAIKAVEAAFREYGLGRATMPGKAYLDVGPGDFRAMPAALLGAVGIKWVNVHPGNPSRGLPTVMATLIYNDPETGYPLAVMDGTEITAYRTGAAAAVASHYLARPNPRTLGIIGAGRQAQTQLLAHLEIFQFREIRVYDRSAAAADKFIQSFPNQPVSICSLRETAASDIVCTVTPAREPVLQKEWVAPGTHINAIGADAEGKEELDPAILQEAVVVVDDLRQAAAAGEINVPVRKGLFRIEQVYASLGQVVAGQKPGRQDSKSVTVFDSTGVAIEDIAVAQLIYRQAVQAGGFLTLHVVD